jgi:hypothetical protein
MEQRTVIAPAVQKDAGMPRELVFWGIVVGLVLAAGGVAMMAFLDPRVSHLGVLTTCVGFGLVLAAFGTRTTGTWRSWSAAGSGAMAVLLFLLVQIYAPCSVVIRAGTAVRL